jgi:hypothetical protein
MLPSLRRLQEGDDAHDASEHATPASPPVRIDLSPEVLGKASGHEPQRRPVRGATADDRTRTRTGQELT